MKAETLRKRIISICKYCKHYTDLGKKADKNKRHYCVKKERSIYEACEAEPRCKKLILL